MELLVLLCLLGVVWSIALVLRSEQTRLDIWRRIASDRGLELASRTRLSGNCEGRLVEVRLKSGTSGYRGRLTVMRVRGARPSEVRLGKGSILARLKMPRADTGASEFDARLEVGGPPGLVLGLFDGSTRAMVLEATRAGWEYASGEWRATFQGVLKESLGEAIDVGLGLARALENPEDLPGRLCQRACHDPSVEGRVKCLAKLLTEFPGTPAAERALQHSIGAEADVQVRLLAGRALGDVPVLAETAYALCRPPFPKDGATVDTASAALEVLSRRYFRTEEAQRVLGAWLTSGAARDPRSKRALVEALGDIEHPDATRHLLDMVSSGETETLRGAAMASLGRVGTLDAIPHLLPYRDRVFSLVLKAAARDAIQKIQTRAGRAPAGSLSLAPTESGALAVVGDELS